MGFRLSAPSRNTESLNCLGLNLASEGYGFSEVDITYQGTHGSILGTSEFVLLAPGNF